ncbi:pentapeptide repeat-containing protein [Pedobacter polaris]|nr:pentapeptide repeat-containing protein [Pedobacter polaris]
MKTIGNKIAEARKKIKISQAGLAERLFISPQAVGKWERGESMPDITTFERLAGILGVDLNYFSESFESDLVAPSALNTQDTEVQIAQRTKPVWDLSRGNWTDADFSGLKGLHEKLSSSNLQRCLFIGSDLSGLLLKTNNVESCDFSSSNINGSHIQGSHLDNNLFKDSSLKSAKFSKSYFMGCDFSGSDFDDSDIRTSYFDGNLFKNSSLKAVKLFKSYLKGCDFSGSDFSQTELRSGGFEHNNLKGVVWKETSFIGTQLKDLTFDGTIEGCYFENCSFDWVKFENANLIGTFFKNNRFKRMKFVDCTTDAVTYGFLKNGGANLDGLTLIDN